MIKGRFAQTLAATLAMVAVSSHADSEQLRRRPDHFASQLNRFHSAQPFRSPSLSTTTAPLQFLVQFPLAEQIEGYGVRRDPAALAALKEKLVARAEQLENQPDELRNWAEALLQLCLVERFPGHFGGRPARLKDPFNRAEALKLCRRSAEAWQQVVSDAPSDSAALERLACGYLLAAQAALRPPVDDAEIRAGLPWLERAMDIWQKSAEQADGDQAAKLVRQLNHGYEILAAWRNRSGDAAGAIATMVEAKPWLERAAKAKDEAGRARSLARYHATIAALARKAGDMNALRVAQRQSIGQKIRLWKAAPDDAKSAISLLESLTAGVQGGAFAADAEEPLKLGDEVAAKFVEDDQIQREWASLLIAGGVQAELAGNLELSIENFRRAIEVKQRLLPHAEKETEMFTYEFSIPYEGLCTINVMRDLMELAEMRREAGQRKAAREDYERAFALWRQLLKSDPLLTEPTRIDLSQLLELAEPQRLSTVRNVTNWFGIGAPPVPVVKACQQAASAIYLGQARLLAEQPEQDLEAARAAAQKACELVSYQEAQAVGLLADIFRMAGDSSRADALTALARGIRQWRAEEEGLGTLDGLLTEPPISEPTGESLERLLELSNDF